MGIINIIDNFFSQNNTLDISCRHVITSAAYCKNQERYHLEMLQSELVLLGMVKTHYIVFWFSEGNIVNVAK